MLKELKQIRTALLSWYAHNKRDLPWRRTSDAYTIWVSEVMLQQTQVKTVIPYFKRFISRFPDPCTLAVSDIQDVLKLWEGLGYYSRARNLHRAASIVIEKYNGHLPCTMEEMRALPGVGDYIASAVLSIAFGQTHAVVDGNVKRVLSRLLKIDAPVNAASSHGIFKTRAGRMISPENPASFNQAIMEIGALICKPKSPVCNVCPLSDWCGSFKKGIVEKYPKRVAKPAVPHHHMVIGVILKDDKLLIVKRKLNGFLGGMWEFPGGRIKTTTRLSVKCLKMIAGDTNLSVIVLKKLTRIHHAYTHFKITADVYLCGHVSGNVKLRKAIDHRWVEFKNLTDYPIHGTTKKAITGLEHAVNVIGS